MNGNTVAYIIMVIVTENRNSRIATSCFSFSETVEAEEVVTEVHQNTFKPQENNSSIGYRENNGPKDTSLGTLHVSSGTSASRCCSRDD